MSHSNSYEFWFRFRRFSLWVFVCCLFFLFFGQALFFFTYPLLTYADQALYLYCGRLILEGGLPYIDVFDWNPPLVMYLAMIPVLAAKVLQAIFSNSELLRYSFPFLSSLSLEILSFNLLTLACGCYSALLSMFLFYRYKGAVSLWLRMPMLFLFGFYFCGQNYSFGEREHLHFGLILPLLVLRLLRLHGKNISSQHSLAAALPASLTLLFKPQFLLAYCAFEVILSLQEFRPQSLQSQQAEVSESQPKAQLKSQPESQPKAQLKSQPESQFKSQLKSLLGKLALFVPLRLRFYRQPEIYCLLVMVLGYLGWFFFLFPADARTCYLQEILPMYDSAYGFSRRAFLLLFRADSLILQSVSISFAGLFLGLVLSRRSVFAAALTAFLAVSLVNYFYGNQVWLYRLVPCEGAAFLVLGEAFYLYGVSVSRRSRGRLMALSLVYMLFAAFFCAQSFAYAVNARKLDCSAPLDEVGGRVLGLSGRKDTVLWLGTGISPGFPAILQCGLRPGSRYAYSVLAQVNHAMSISPANRAHFEPLFRKMLAQYKSYILEKKPRLIVLQTNPMQAFLKQGEIDLTAFGYREAEVYGEYSFFVLK